MRSVKRIRVLFVSLITTVMVGFPAYAETVTGVVFEAWNENRAFDAGEPGVSSVAVSNGLDVVLTDDEGRYTLDVDGNTILFVSKPAVSRDNPGDSSATNRLRVPCAEAEVAAFNAKRA